jgi:hypothetical protein
MCLLVPGSQLAVKKKKNQKEKRTTKTLITNNTSISIYN